VIKSRRMKLGARGRGVCSRHREERNAYRFLVEKLNTRNHLKT
jgi:hypothetical protein